MRWNLTWFVGETTVQNPGERVGTMRDCSLFSVLIFPLKSITVLSTAGGVNSPGWAALSYTSKELVMKTSPETGHTERRAVRVQLATLGCSAVSLGYGEDRSTHSRLRTEGCGLTCMQEMFHIDTLNRMDTGAFFIAWSLYLWCITQERVIKQGETSVVSCMFIWVMQGIILPYLTVKVFLLRKAYEIYLLL